MKKYIEKLKSNKKVLYISIAILVVFIGTTFAYVVAQLSGGAKSLFNLNADTTDQLEFDVDKDLSLSANQFNFAEGKGNLSDQAVATARLKANSTKNTARYTYNVYLLIDKNEFVYTTSEKKTEILLQVTDPNGRYVNEIKGLTYNNDLSGFDITEKEYLLPIIENYEIMSESSSNYIEQTWTIKVTFINLDTNQKDNAGKTLSGKILIQQEREHSDIKLYANGYEPAHISNITAQCNGAVAEWNSEYSRLEISNVNNWNPYCTFSSSESIGEKDYFNNHIINLTGTMQGGGSVVHEMLIQGDYTNTIPLTQSQYGTISQYYSSSYNSTSGTTVTNAFQYSENEWVSQPSNMTSRRYYNINFTIPSDGYYQFCYELSSGSTSNRLYLYQGSTQLRIGNASDISASSTDSKNGCTDLGNVNAGTSYRVMQYTYASISTLKFSIKKASSTNTFDTGYRYEGPNPNNWVSFNNELWRIIGVFENDGKQLVKIVKDGGLPALVAATNTDMKFENSGLQKMLNDYYMYSLDGSDSGYCYKYYNVYYNTEGKKSDCNYKEAGIKSSYRNMINKSKWHLAKPDGNSNTAFTLAEQYLREKNSDNIWEGYIGLIYPSDAGYGALEIDCERSIALDNTGNCSTHGWLATMFSGEYLMSELSYAVLSYMDNNGYIADSGAMNGASFRPSLYLKEKVYVLRGDGSLSNPYIIEM